VIKRDFPKIHFYDQDFVDIYDKTWAWIQDCWGSGSDKFNVHGAHSSKSSPPESLCEDIAPFDDVEDVDVEAVFPTEAAFPTEATFPTEAAFPAEAVFPTEAAFTTEAAFPTEAASPVVVADSPMSLPTENTMAEYVQNVVEDEGETVVTAEAAAPVEDEAAAEQDAPTDAPPVEGEAAAAPEVSGESVPDEVEAPPPEDESSSLPRAVSGKFFSYPGSSVIQQTDAIYSSFFLVYSNRIYQAHPTLDIFYDRQEPDGAIRNAYDIKTGEPVLTPDNPEGVGIPLFAWAEFNLYHKSANKKRVKDVLPILNRYIEWLDTLFKRPNGLYAAPVSAAGMVNSPRENVAYPMDFNCMMAINVLYMSALSDILNDKEASFQYKKLYFALKTRINGLMWNAEDGFYYDIDEEQQHIRVKTIAGYWPLLAEIPNDDKAERIIAKLQDPQYFGAPHPFPTVAVNEPSFDENGCGYRGSVYPHLTFMVIKGLERYQRWDFARECAIRHLYFVLDSMTDGAHNNHHGAHRGNLWEAYLPLKEGHALWPENPDFPRVQYLTYDALSTICLTIENIVGLFISLPRKTVDWIIPSLEIMGIENLSLKKNMITILSNKSGRGWEIHMESEKLYYFTINILGKKKKTLPIPSGKCSMLIDKL
jgi:neutral trehalase